MIVQFRIQGKVSSHTFKFEAKTGKYYDNNTEINKETYDKALEFFNASRIKK